MSLKMSMIAKIDGDQFVNAMRIGELRAADLGLKFEISLAGATFGCDTVDETIAVLKALVVPPTDSK